MLSATKRVECLTGPAYRDDLREMFHDSVERTLYLIEQQVGLIEICEGLTLRVCRPGLTPSMYRAPADITQTIFLSGGFAQSGYLYNKVKEFGRQRKVEVKRGNDCWIAVAKGAIIKTLGVYTDKPQVVKSCPRHYGIKVRRRYASYENHLRRDVDVDPEGVEWATDQIRWFVQMGDGLFPGKSKVVTHDCHFSMKASDYEQAKRKRGGSSAVPSLVMREILVISSSRDRPPTRLDAIDAGEIPNPISNILDIPF